MTLQEQIRQYIDGNRGSMLDLWRELVDIDSGTLQIDGVNRVCAVLQSEMESAGIHTRRIPVQNAGDMLIGEWNMEDNRAPFLFLGHMDTVFGEGEAKRRPFRVDERKRAHGPGCLDMKGGLVIGLYAARALIHLNIRKHPIKFIYVSDEENLHMFSDAKRVLAAEAEGAVAAFNFETGDAPNRFVTGRKGGGPVVINVHGVASHSGIAPEKGRSAVKEAAYKIIELENQNDFERGRLINCGMVEGGRGENTIPDAAQIRIGIRFPDNAVRREILDILTHTVAHSTVPGTSAELDISRVMPSMDTTDGTRALLCHLERAAGACGYGPVEGFDAGGLSDSNIVANCGVPTICGMGVCGAYSHTAQEYADVETLYGRCILAAYAAATFQDS